MWPEIPTVQIRMVKGTPCLTINERPFTRAVVPSLACKSGSAQV